MLGLPKNSVTKKVKVVTKIFDKRLKLKKIPEKHVRGGAIVY